MDIWTRRMVVATTLLTAGCTGEIQAPPGTGPGSGGPGSGSGNSSGTGSGASPGTGGGAGSATGGAAGNAGGGGTGATDPTTCVPGVPATTQLPRLTKVQYNNTIRDLVGVTSDPASLLAPDSTGSVDDRAWSGYKNAADAVAAEIMTDPAARARAIPCTPSGDGAACASQAIQDFGRRAFRRPLTAEETARFESMYANRAQVTAMGTFDEAMQLILRSFLISPSFLTRAEISETPEGNLFTLNGYELASRLSYMIWSSTPDEELLQAAASNALSTPEGIRAQADRMLRDPRAREMVQSFHDFYAHMGEGTRWAAIQRDTALYPAFTQAMVPALSDETRRFFDFIVFEQGGTFQDLLTSRVGFVNSTLAPLYGLDPAAYGAALTQVNLDPAQRSGVFTRAGFLTAYSLFNRPSAILRGAFIQKEVLCTVIGAPPPGAEGTPLPTDGLLTNRERTDAQTAGGDCAGCHHGLINPTGYPFEMFDAVGTYQTAEKDTGAPINTAATVLLGATEATVTNAIDLMDALAASPEAQRCYAQKWVEFAYARGENSADACTVQTLTASMAQGGYTVLNLIADLTQSQSFRYRALEP